MLQASVLAPASSGQFLLQVLALVTGGGLVQLVIFLLRRKSELVALDRTSAGPLLEGQVAFIDRLTVTADRALNRVAALEDQTEADAIRFAEVLRQANRENHRLSAEVAELRSDLDIAQRQVAELRRQLGETPPPARPPTT